MSFRKYGGLDRAATNNIVRSNYATGNNESITVALGQENSKIICKSHLDLSGNSLINVGSIYFMEEAHLYGNLIMDGTVTILETTTLYGPLIVNNTSYFAGASTFNSNVTINGPLVVNNTSYFAGNSTFNSNVTINGALNLDGGILTSSAATFLFLPYSSTTIEYGGDTTTNIIMGTEQSTAPDNGALVVKGGVGIGKNLNVGGDTLIGGSLGVTGPTNLYNTLTVEGNATFNSSVGISGPLGVTGPVHFYNTLTVDGDATFNSSVGVSGPLGVSGPTNLYNTLTVGGTAIFNGPVGISGSLGVSGTLNVGGTATFGNSIVLSGPTGSIIMNGPTGNYIQFPDQTKQYTASGAVPPGTIVMWSNNGSIGIPIYWSLCDGTSVTGQITNNGYTPPNLTDRFVYGGNISQIGNSGGATGATLTTTNMPAHSHVVSGGAGTFLTSALLPRSEHVPTDLAAPFQAFGDQNIQTQSSTFSTSLANAYGNSQGTADSFPILPPYYRLCYIMFTP